MSSRLGPLAVECDAPQYTVVRACREIGLDSPEDVRWRRMSNFRQRREVLSNLFGSRVWEGLFGGKEAPAITCTCGQLLPTLETCSFLFASGRTQAYNLGQCRRCRTIFWEEA